MLGKKIRIARIARIRRNRRNKDNQGNKGTATTPQAIRDAVNFESLENRQLMAVVNVADFGAKPNDGQDDRAAIQRAIDASASGDTIQFQAGTYNVNAELHARTDRTMNGARNWDTHLKFNVGSNC